MGFDVLYLPPIHPIGQTSRKGKNNAAPPGPEDPGSPWAIGSAAGGHTSIHPELGTMDEFDRLVAKAQSHGIEIALDLAFQCSPDHPYVRQHPDWFSKRQDGSIRYAENPPKKYEDIFPLDFETPQWREMWEELRSVVQFWIGHGVRIFRVDNPHTKALPFWEWMIGEVKANHPDVLFLAETLGCPLDAALETAAAGFDYVFNNLKWWDFTGGWMARQYLLTREIAPSVSFAETHDTARLAEELNGATELCQHRYLLSAVFSAAVMMPMGFEYGFRRRLHVAHTRPEDWEHTGVDMRAHVRRVNAIKGSHAIFQEDSPMAMHTAAGDGNILIFWKGSVSTREEALILVNRDQRNSHRFQCDNLASLVQSDQPFTDLSPGNGLRPITSPFHHELRPGEVMVLVTNRKS